MYTRNKLFTPRSSHDTKPTIRMNECPSIAILGQRQPLIRPRSIHAIHSSVFIRSHARHPPAHAKKISLLITDQPHECTHETRTNDEPGVGNPIPIDPDPHASFIRSRNASHHNCGWVRTCGASSSSSSSIASTRTRVHFVASPLAQKSPSSPESSFATSS